MWSTPDLLILQNVGLGPVMCRVGLGRKSFGVDSALVRCEQSIELFPDPPVVKLFSDPSAMSLTLCAIIGTKRLDMTSTIPPLELSLRYET